MKLIEIENQKLYELFELIINEKLQHDFDYYWISKEDCIRDIIDFAQQEGYDGDMDNYDAIYWYFKGKRDKEKPKEEPTAEPKEEPKKIIKTEDKTQFEITNRIMEKLEDSPTNWYIDFERLDNDGRKLLLPKLKKFFEEHIDALSYSSSETASSILKSFILCSLQYSSFNLLFSTCLILLLWLLSSISTSKLISVI